MFPSYSIRFGKPKHNSSHARRRKVRSTGAVRTSDISHSKLGNILKSFRRKRLREEVTRKGSLSVARSQSPPDSSKLIASRSHPYPPIPLSDRGLLLSQLSSLRPADTSRSDVSSITTVTEEDFPCSMSMSGSSLDHVSAKCESERCHPPRIGLAASPSTFKLRSISAKDYFVERLEQDLQRLSLSEEGHASASSLLPGLRTRDTLSADLPLGRPAVDACPTPIFMPEANPASLTAEPSQRDTLHATFSPDDVEVPVIVITSVNAKHAKQLQSSARSSKTPLRFSNMMNSVSAISSVKEMTFDDPFISSSGPLCSDHAFRLPPVPLMPVRDTRVAHTHLPAWCSPETPTRTGCEKFASCKEDLLDVLHSPLVTQPFFLPPFALPPLRPPLFGGTSSPSHNLESHLLI